MMSTKLHEGTLLRNYIKGKGFAMGDVAEKLDMTRQGLNKHLSKESISDDFLLKIINTLNVNLQEDLLPILNQHPELEPEEVKSAEPNPNYFPNAKLLHTFTLEEEVGMRITAYTLSNLLMAHDKGAIEAVRNYRVQQCWEDAKILFQLMRPVKNTR